jgi:hypothetical protein
MCVSAGYNERCHITTAFPTQGHIQMKQQTELYYDCRTARDEINDETEEGWFVHSMVSGTFSEGGDADAAKLYATHVLIPRG